MSEAGTRRGWREALRTYAQRPVLSMLFLGFSAGLPFYLVFQTLSAWLRQEGIERATIGMLAWVGFTYTFKWVWSPIVDRFRLPLLHRWLGKRRSWMLVAQLGIGWGLLNLAASEPSTGITQVAVGALFLAFCSATQDIAIDAWRIESAALDDQGAMVAAYQIGYRAALIVGSAGALGIAQGYGWATSYTVMACLAGIGVATTFLVREPAASAAAERDAADPEARVVDWLGRRAHWPAWLRSLGASFIGAVVCPFADFFSRYGGRVAAVTLLLISTYRLTEFTMGSMANPFYIDQGYTLGQIAAVVKTIGLPVSMIGVVIAGFLIAKAGLRMGLFLGSLLIAGSNLGFALLATAGTPTLVGLGLVNAFDNFAQGIHGTALIAFLSGLTSARYTATQYALFSSLYALIGKFLEGTSGFVVDAIGYPAFFTYTASLSLPGLALLAFLARRRLLDAHGRIATRAGLDAADVR